MKSLFLSLVAGMLCFSLSEAVAAVHKTTLLRSLKNQEVTLTKISSRGGYMGQCLAISVRNNTSRDLSVQVDPALIFTPSENRYQHLVAVGEEEIVLKPGEEKSRVLQTFCGKARAAAPHKDIRYKLWKQGSKEMILASKYIKDHRQYNSLGQHAIWMFTDHHCLSNVYDHGRSTESKAFVSYLAGITKQQVPEYYTYHKIYNDTLHRREVYDVDVSRVFVDVDWKGEHRRNLHVLVLDAQRNLYRSVENGEVSNSEGIHNVKVDFDPLKDPLGEYFVQLKDDENNIWLEKKVILQHTGCH